MSTSYNADEVFEIACAIERNGARFYRKAAGQSSDEETAGLLRELAVMEDQHLETFQRMRGAVVQATEDESYDPDQVAEFYLRALADGHVFDAGGDPSERLSGDEEIEDVLDMAIEIEKESVVYYAGLRTMVPEGPGRDAVDDIVKQELGHIAALSDRLVDLNR